MQAFNYNYVLSNLAPGALSDTRVEKQVQFRIITYLKFHFYLLQTTRERRKYVMLVVFKTHRP